MPRRKRSSIEEKFPGCEDAFIKIAEYIAQQKEKGNLSLSSFLQDMINAIAEAERKIYLKEHPDNSANGFYGRNLLLSIGDLNIKVPRVRIGNTFRPSLLPARWKRVDKDYENLLLALLVNGYSRAKIKATLERLGMPYREEAIEDLTDLIYDHLDAYKTSPLPEEMFAVFIDAYHGKLRDENGKMGEVSIFVAVGINMEGYKEILGFWVKKGKENKAFWMEVFQDMISRGLSRVAIFVTDDFSGIVGVTRRFFPQSDHQLCWVHMKRNLKKEFRGEELKEMKKELEKVKVSGTKEEGEGHWKRFVEIVKQHNPVMGKRYEERGENYLAFLSYPEEIRKYIYTTNIVESVNAGLEKIRQELGGYFPSQKSMEVNLFIQFSNLNDVWMRRPITDISSNLYRLRQIMRTKFESEEVI